MGKAGTVKGGAIVNGGMFTSDSIEWATPAPLFERLRAEFGITFDVCASAENAKTARFFTVTDDALTRAWPREEVCFMNPPYGRGIGEWVRRARSMGLVGVSTVCLLPARTDTKWWQENVENEEGERFASQVRFLRGRIRFSGSRWNAPFPSAVVLYKGVN